MGFEEWEDTIYTCDSCGYDGPGKYYNIQIRGWKPLILCEGCMNDCEVENE